MRRIMHAASMAAAPQTPCCWRHCGCAAAEIPAKDKLANHPCSHGKIICDETPTALGRVRWLPYGCQTRLPQDTQPGVFGLPESWNPSSHDNMDDEYNPNGISQYTPVAQHTKSSGNHRNPYWKS
ncbi:unnamed protein product [Cercospora beticola]|nr:unnamed protein product [Cercospora beticola]